MTHQHKIPDEVVEAAIEVHDAEKWRYELNPVGALNPKEQMHAALQTALSMLLGEPKCWLIDWPDEPELGEYFSTDPAPNDFSRSLPLYALKEKQS